MKSTATLRSFLCIASSAFLTISSAHAVSGSWADNTGNSNWSDATKWSSNPVVPGTTAGDVINFTNNISAARTITINTTNRTMGTLNIGDSDNTNRFIIAASGGGILILDNGGSGAAITEVGFVAGGSGTPNSSQDAITAPVRLDDNLAASIGGQLSINGVISETGSRSITKTGAGILVLNGLNTYTGGFNLNQGEVMVNTGSISGGISQAFGTGKLTIAGGTTINALADFQLNNLVDMSGTVNLARGVSGVKVWTQGSAGTVTLTGNTVLNSANNGFTYVVNSSIGETGVARTLTLQGNTLTATLNNANTYTGGTTLNTITGTLNINHAGSGGTSSAIGTGKLTIAGGTIDNSSAAALTLSTNNAIDINANFAFTGTRSLNMGTGAVVLSATRTITANASTLTLGGTISGGAFGITKAGLGTLVLTGNNTTTGDNTVSAGVLNIQNAGALGTGAGTTAATGGELQLQGGINVTAEGLLLTTSNSGVVRFSSISGNNTWGGSIAAVTGGAGHLNRIQSDLDTLTLSGQLNSVTGGVAASSYVFQGAGNITVTGKITGQAGVISGSVGASSTSIRTLSNDTSDFTGRVGVSGGVLAFTSVADSGVASALGAGTVNPTIGLGSGATNGTLRYTGTAGGGHTSNRAIDLVGTGGVVSIEANGVGVLVFNGTNTATGAGAKVITLTGTNTGANSISAIVENSGTNTTSVTKDGVGTWVLTGTNTYTGTTSVSAGKMVVSGSIGASAVTVSGTNTILATDTAASFGSTLAIQNGAILAAGDAAAAGVATVTGNTTFDNGSIFSWDIDETGDGYDQLVSASLVDGNAAGGSTFRIVASDALVTAGFWNTTKTWSNIFTTDGTIAIADWVDIFTDVTVVDSSFASITPVGGSFSASGNTLTWTAVPEPTSALAGLLITAGLLRRRRAS